MSIHFSSGRLLLQNVSDNNWYYLDVRINSEGLPTLHPEQVIAFNNGEVDYDIYVLIRADNGIVYKLGLETNSSGEIDFSWVEAAAPFTQRPINLYLKDSTTGLLYRITGVKNLLDNLVYVNVAVASLTTGTETRTVPCTCATEASVMSPDSNLIEAGVLEECSILVSTGAVLPSSETGILGEQGENILGEGGEVILPEDGTPSSGSPVEGEAGEDILGEGSEEILGE